MTAEDRIKRRTKSEPLTPATAIGRSGTGGVQSVRFTLALLDDRELLERSRMADKGPTERLKLEA